MVFFFYFSVLFLFFVFLVFQMISFGILRFNLRRIFLLFDLLAHRAFLVPSVSQTSNATSSATKKVLLVLVGIVLAVGCVGGT